MSGSERTHSPPVRLIGVLDLLDGRAVHARGGRRADYAPVRDVAGSTIAAGDALALARWYVDAGITELYVADLDAIQQRAGQHALIEAVARIGVPVWLDAGVTTVTGARDALARGACQVVVGLETLTTFQVLEEICAEVGGVRVAFSLDLRDGQPVALESLIESPDPGPRLAHRAAAAGVGTIIVLDLARVGTGAGLDLPVIARVRRAAPGVGLLAGGGVRDQQDLALLAAAGGDGALVATALQSGALTIPR